MLVLIVERNTRVEQVSCAPECDCRHYEGEQPKAVTRKHTEIGDFNLCLSCTMQVPRCNTICAYDAVDNPVVILAEGEA